MLTKEKSLYQVKLILDCLPKEEYDLIPPDVIQYVEQNAEFDDTITINPTIPLEKQNLDSKTYAFLEGMLKRIDMSKTSAKNVYTTPSLESIQKANESMKLEISKLKEIIAQNKVELNKIPEARGLIEDYQRLIVEKDDRISKLTEDNEKLRSYINSTPSWIRRFFMKDINLMLDGK